MSDYKSGGDKNNDLKIFPLRNEDLVFSKNRDGILSCGYKVSNALLNSTLSMSMMGGGKDSKKEHGKNKNKGNGNGNENEIKNAKLMEDLVIPSSLYCSKPVNNSKVFNYKKGKREKSKKGSRSSSDNDNDSDDNVIEESLYDKLLSLVTPSNKVKYDKKTRKKVNQDNKININKNTPVKKSTLEEGVKKNKNNKTKKVRFNLE
jgi:hypothetical protein